MRNVAAFPPAGPTKVIARKTYHDGANEERSAILAKVRRMKKQEPCNPLLVLEEWLLQRNERYDAKTGGLGRR